MNIGYARVSTMEQDTAIQLAALAKADVVVYWEDQISGIKERPALEEALNLLSRGDCLIVYKIDRLARSLHDLLRIAQRIQACGATLRSLTEPIETQTSVGRMMFQLLGAFAEFERNVINERCHAGRVAAMARGVKFGRNRQLDYAAVFRMRKDGATYREIAAAVGGTHVGVKKIYDGIVSGRLHI